MSEVISLKKQQPISLKKTAPTITQLRVELFWEPQRIAGKTFDLDANLFALEEDSSGPVLKSLQDLCFFNNQSIFDGAIAHIKGDNRTGISSEGECDESILIKLDSIPERIKRLDLNVTIDEAIERGQTFAGVERPMIKLYNNLTNDLIGQVDLKADIDPTSISAQFYTMIRNGSDWQFELIAKGQPANLSDYVTKYRCS